MTGNLVETNGLAVMRGSRKVIHSLDLTIPNGEWFGLIGANGSGKTSLLRAITGRLPIAAGSCRIKGIELQDSRFARAKILEFAPPQETLPASLSSEQIFELLDPEWRQNLGPLFDILGLERFYKQAVRTYSAGMKQRTTIACAFARRMDAVVLDEPFNWLDPLAAYDLREALREWVTPDRCLITALHDTSTLINCCDRGTLLANGDVVFNIDALELEKAQSNPNTFENEMIARLRSL